MPVKNVFSETCKPYIINMADGWYVSFEMWPLPLTSKANYVCTLWDAYVWVGVLLYIVSVCVNVSIWFRVCISLCYKLALPFLCGQCNISTNLMKLKSNLPVSPEELVPKWKIAEYFWYIKIRTWNTYK